jgi:general stress protein 26
MEQVTKEKLDFNKSRAKLVSFLDNRDNPVMVLATSVKNRVITRSVLITNNELDLYFFTWRYSRKIEQIEINNNISLCKDKIEIEGKAKILGLMTSKENESILNMIRKKYPDSVKQWESKPDMIIVHVRSEFACIDGYFENSTSYLEYIDLTKEESYRIKWAEH